MFKTDIVVPKAEAADFFKDLQSKPIPNMTVEAMKQASTAETSISTIIQSMLRRIDATWSFLKIRSGLESIGTVLDSYSEKDDAFIKAAAI